MKHTKVNSKNDMNVMNIMNDMNVMNGTNVMNDMNVSFLPFSHLLRNKDSFCLVTFRRPVLVRNENQVIPTMKPTM